MFNKNAVSLIGNAGKVEIKATNGKRYAVINLATNERRTDRETGEVFERVDWHRCVTFRPKTVDLIERFVKKSDFLAIEGKLRSGSFEKGGETVYTYEVEISNIGFLSPKQGAPADEPAED